MQIEAITVQSSPSALLGVTGLQQLSGPSSLHRERVWRQSAILNEDFAKYDGIQASCWTDERTVVRRERSIVPSYQYVVAIALRPVRIRLGSPNDTIFEGTMPTGMVHVSEPGQTVEAEFSSPCEFIHFHVAAGYLRDRQAAVGLHRNVDAPVGERRVRDLLFRDDLAAQLSRTLTDEFDGGDPYYAASVGQTILMRALASRAPASRVGALPKWRLRRVQEYLAANVAEPITLADLAEAAGLSRMHFAAQFRAATGCSPHEYLLQHRIEYAKHMLTSTNTPIVEVALSVGFQTQSHFSTVFKRLAGDTPARWQRCQRAGAR